MPQATQTLGSEGDPRNTGIQSQASNQSFMETLSLILQDEMDRRRSRQIERRYALSGLTEKLTLHEFDWGYNPKIPKKACFELMP